VEHKNIDPKTIPEIREAIRLFEEFERSSYSYTEANKFNEAVDLLNDYLDSEPDSIYKDYIQRLRLSYTRSLLRNLARVDKADFISWGQYVFTIFKVKGEADALMLKFPELKADFDEFLNIWKKELALLLVVDEEGSLKT
jgi:hypothetical protein